MSGFLGQYLCKIDAKGRIKIPTGLKKQLESSNKGRFVVNFGFEKCLHLYPKDEWKRISTKVKQLNTFEKKKRDFVRFFFRGATEVQMDTADRILIPRHLLDYAGIKKELYLAAQVSIIEIWDKPTYDKMISVDSDEYSNLGEIVMGDGELNADK